MINLRSRKDVHNLVGVPKRRAESISIQKETQIEKEPQSSTSQHTGESSQATTFAENDDPTHVDNEAPTQNMAKEKQSAEHVAAQQFRHPPPFPQRFQRQQQDKQFSKILGVLKQLHINIPFVEALEQMPNYVKNFKDILTQECSRML